MSDKQRPLTLDEAVDEYNFPTIAYDGCDIRGLVREVKAKLSGGAWVIVVDMSTAVEPPFAETLIKLNNNFGGGRGHVYKGEEPLQIVVDATDIGSDSENDGCRPLSTLDEEDDDDDGDYVKRKSEEFSDGGIVMLH
jgi:hypothetical protein